jgi:hypothetical protein
MDRHPKLVAFLDLWQSKRRGNAHPARADFSMEDLRPFLGRIGILDVVDGGADFRFRVYGSAIANAYKGEMTGKSVNDYRSNFRDIIVPGYRRCYETGEPQYDVLEVDDDLMRYRWERVVVPLAADGRTVDMIMVCTTDQFYEDRS